MRPFDDSVSMTPDAAVCHDILDFSVRVLGAGSRFIGRLIPPAGAVPENWGMSGHECAVDATDVHFELETAMVTPNGMPVRPAT